ncbi:MAG: Trm112 family protein [Hyphomicrobiaceae bacterium]|nr:Trm112 family protein [Hyphomicrobiaceae bacterium]
MVDDAESGDGIVESQRAIDPRLLAILVCPVTKHPLRYDPVRQELISKAARLAYPVRDGVPILTSEAARALDDPPHQV